MPEPKRNDPTRSPAPSAGGRTKFLYLTHEAPWPADAGHKLRYTQLLRILGCQGEVHFLAFTGPDAREPRTPQEIPGSGTASHMLVPRAIRIRRRPLALLRIGILSLIRGAPYSELKFKDSRMKREVRQLLHGVRPEAVLATLPMLQNLSKLPPGTKRILDSHNIEHQMWEQATDLVPGYLRPFVRREAALLKAREIKAWNEVDCILTICDEDAATIRSMTSRPVVTIPPVVDAPEAIIVPAPPIYDAALLGVWTWGPNELALQDLLAALELRQDKTPLRLAIAGRGIRPTLAQRLQQAGAEVLGFVEDLDAFYRNTRCVIAPYHLGAGVRLKVLEAMTHGVPVLGTPLALRGIRGDPRMGALMRREADELLESAHALRQDPPSREALAQGALLRVAHSHRESHAHEALSELLAKAGIPCTGQGRVFQPMGTASGKSNAEEAMLPP